MVKKSAHPQQLFDYLNGRTEEAVRQVVEGHLSICPDCRSVAELARVLQDDFAGAIGRIEKEQLHPDVSELAAFYYGKQPRAPRSLTATHVAKCSSCAGALAEYAHAERAAAEYDPSHAVPAEVPASAWTAIQEWDQSSFAETRPASYSMSREMIVRLTRLVAEHETRARSNEPGDLMHPASETKRAVLVPVMVVDRSGGLRSVEMFERTTDASGRDLLKYQGESQRFDQRPFHALLDYGDTSRIVVSDLVHRDEVRLPRVEADQTDLRGADYFIMED